MKEVNLVAECLNTKQTKTACREYLAKDKILRREIENKIVCEGLISATNLIAEEVPLDEVNDEGDGYDIPLARVAEELTDDPEDVRSLFSTALSVLTLLTLTKSLMDVSFRPAPWTLFGRIPLTELLGQAH